MHPYNPIDHALRYCRNCQDNTCCRSVDGDPWRCKKCESTLTDPPRHLLTYHELQAREKAAALKLRGMVSNRAGKAVRK